MTINPPLTINVRIFDVKTDKEERKTSYRLRKIDVDLREHKNIKSANEEYEKQKEALDKKWKSLQDTIIWAMNNGKSVEFVNNLDDKE